MKNIYIFNPENDLAIAHGKKRYDAPKAARRLAADLALLPLWYAPNDANTLILTPTNVPTSYQRDIYNALKLSANWIYEKDYTASSEDIFRPWGWSPAMAERIERMTGANIKNLPDLSQYRRLSGRQFAVSILSALQAEGELDSHIRVPAICSTLESLASVVAQHSSTCLLKSPWSGSGKGLLWVRNGWDATIEAWSNNVLKRQGEVVFEPFYNKVQDFAMEFQVNHSQLTFVGYSYFQTDETGTYRGNLLASNSHIEQRMSEWISVSQLTQIRQVLMRHLSSHLAPYYEGYFGIDMMVCQSENGYFLHPCVELNLRYNMGIVSRFLHDNYISANAIGEYVIMHGRNAAELQALTSQMTQKHPLEIVEGKITNGFLPLTYLSDESEFMAYALVGRKSES